MATPTSHIQQRSPGLVKQAIPREPHPPGETFQLLDPPKVAQAPWKRVRRDTRIYKLTAECTALGTTDTVFQMLTREPDPANPGSFIIVDLLDGAGVLAAGEDEADWYLVPLVEVRRTLHRVAVNVTQVGAGTSGLVFEFLYTQEGLT